MIIIQNVTVTYLSDIGRVHSQLRIISVITLYLQADICFLVDCTGSMHSWLNAIKETVKTLEQNIRKEFLEGEVRFAFVGYTDYDVPKKDRIKSKDFTK